MQESGQEMERGAITKSEHAELEYKEEPGTKVWFKRPANLIAGLVSEE